MSEEQRKRQEPLDWGAATEMAHGMLTSRAYATTFIARRDGSLGLHNYWQEPLQNAALRAVERDRSGIEALPETTDELAVALAQHAKTIDDNRRALERRRRGLLVTNVESLTPVFDPHQALDLLQEIIAKDQVAKLAERLFDALDPEARRFLEAWLGEGIEFSDTLGFMKRLGIDHPRIVHNIKRRIQFKAQKILAELYGDREGGEAP